MTKMKIKHYIDSLHYDLELTAKYGKVFGAQIFEKYYPDVSGDCFAALDTIFCNEGICQRDLAKLILKDRGNTGKILNTLEEKGLIRRYNDTKNNRLVRKMEITETGKNLLADAVKKFQPVHDFIYQTISEEEERIVRNVLKKYREVLESMITKEI